MDRPSGLTFGPITVVPGEGVVLKDGRPVALTPKAFDLLAYLAANPGRLLTKDELMREVWPDAMVEESNLAANVFAIRKALGEGADGERYIETVPKRGYRFIAPVLPLAAASSSTPDSASATAATDNRGVPSERLASRFTVRLWLYAAAGFAAGSLAVATLTHSRATQSATLPTYFQETAWDRHEGTGIGTLYPFPFTSAPLNVSPDGQHLAIAMAGEDAVPRLWIRRLSDRMPQALAGTETAFVFPFFWSSDSTAVAFDATGSGGLKAVGLAGGAPQTVCDLPGNPIGGSWNQTGVIIVGQSPGPIMKCPAAGGVATPVTLIGAAEEAEAHVFPSFLSDGRHFVYLVVSRTRPERSGIYVTALDGRSPTTGKRLLTTGFRASYVPATDPGSGILVFGRDGALFAQRFDERQLELVGGPIQLADRVSTFLDGADFSASPTTLVYRPPHAPLQLTWLDREGRSVGRLGSPEHMTGFDLSPDGERAIVARYAPLNSFDQDLWLYATMHETNPQRLTSAPMQEWVPRWVDSERFVFTSGGIYQQAVSGERKLLTSTTNRFWPVPSSVSTDGGLTLYSQLRDPKTGVDVWVHARGGDQADDAPLLTRAGNQEQAQISPDERWVAFVSNESGPNEVFVAESRIDPATSRLSIGESAPVSNGGGFAPRWRRDGRELFYRKADGSIMAIDTSHGRGLLPATAKRLFAVPGALPDWGVMPDGARFLFAVPVSAAPPYQIVRDWQALLPK